MATQETKQDTPQDAPNMQTTVELTQWEYLVTPQGIEGSNTMTAAAGPHAGEEIEAFYKLVANLGDNYGSPRFIQEPDLRVDVTVSTLKKDKAGYQRDANGDLEVAQVTKPLVGFVIRNETASNIEDRGSWSNLAVFAKKDYEIDPTTHSLRIEDQEYRIIGYMEPDKNRLDGIVGVYTTADNGSTQRSQATTPPLSYELEDLAALVMPESLTELNQMVKRREEQ